MIETEKRAKRTEDKVKNHRKGKGVLELAYQEHSDDQN